MIGGPTLRLGTRGSALALAQSGMIADDLRVRGQAHGVQVASFVMDSSDTASHQARCRPTAYSRSQDARFATDGTMGDVIVRRSARAIAARTGSSRHASPT